MLSDNEKEIHQGAASPSNTFENMIATSGLSLPRNNKQKTKTVPPSLATYDWAALFSLKVGDNALVIIQ